MNKKWAPHEIKDLDTGRKFLQKKLCPRHGVFYGAFCLKCRLEGLSGLGRIDANEENRPDVL